MDDVCAAAGPHGAANYGNSPLPSAAAERKTAGSATQCNSPFGAHLSAPTTSSAATDAADAAARSCSSSKGSRPIAEAEQQAASAAYAADVLSSSKKVLLSPLLGFKRSVRAAQLPSTSPAGSIAAAPGATLEQQYMLYNNRFHRMMDVAAFVMLVAMFGLVTW